MSHLLKVVEKRDPGPSLTWYIIFKKASVNMIEKSKIHSDYISVNSQNLSRVRKFPYDFIRDPGPTPRWYIFFRKTTVNMKDEPKLHSGYISVYSQNIQSQKKFPYDSKTE